MILLSPSNKYNFISLIQNHFSRIYNYAALTASSPISSVFVNKLEYFFNNSSKPTELREVFELKDQKKIEFKISFGSVREFECSQEV